MLLLFFKDGGSGVAGEESTALVISARHSRSPLVIRLSISPAPVRISRSPVPRRSS